MKHGSMIVKIGVCFAYSWRTLLTQAPTLVSTWRIKTCPRWRRWYSMCSLPHPTWGMHSSPACLLNFRLYQRYSVKYSYCNNKGRLGIFIFLCQHQWIFCSIKQYSLKCCCIHRITLVPSISVFLAVSVYIFCKYLLIIVIL